MAGRIHVGTSGWVYKSWAKTFYPEGVPARRHFEHYAGQFPTVEINATFYRLPEASTFVGWHDQAPRGFRYAVKGSRTVTHFFKLKPGARSYDILLERVRALRSSLGPILWQLPGGFTKDVERLDTFVRALPRSMKHAIEFRDRSWIDDEVRGVLADAGVSSVALSSLAMPPNREVTGSLAYVRFHGLEGGAAHDYTDHELEPWADWLCTLSGRDVDAYVYFNNDVNVRAPRNALRLMEMVGDAAVRPRRRPTAAPAAEGLRGGSVARASGRPSGRRHRAA